MGSKSIIFQEEITMPSSFMFRNRIINGNFDIWQRGVSFSTSNTYSADRWHLTVSGTVTLTQETSDVPSGSTIAAKWTAGAGSSYAQLRQYIESDTVKKLRGKTVTASFLGKLSANFTGTLVFEIYYSTASDTVAAFSGIAVPGVINVGTLSSSGYSQCTSTFTVPTNAVGLYIGVVPTSTQASTAYALIAQVQLEPGSIATPFEFRPYGTELALCQRYGVKLGVLYGYVFTSTSIQGVISHPPMRIAPTASMLTSTPYAEAPISVSPFNATAATVGIALSSEHGTSLLRVGGFTGLGASTNALVSGGTIFLSAEL